MTENRKSLVYAVMAIILWSSLASSSRLVSQIPPFFQLAVAFTIAGLPTLFLGKKAFPPWRLLLLSVAGIFGYHFCLFTALRIAPPLTVNLINYLWPLLLILMTPLFKPNFPLRWPHILGLLIALAGLGVLVAESSFEPGSQLWLGYLLAFAAAVIWPIYSLLKSNSPEVSATTLFSACLLTGVLSFIAHSLLETNYWPQGSEWGVLVWMGAGPFGVAFLLWELALKKGSPQAIGALSYLTPVFSTLLLIIVAGESATARVAIALACLTVGASIGCLDATSLKRILDSVSKLFKNS